MTEMSGRRVLLAAIAITLATAVLPPAAAYTVNRRRVARAMRETSAIAERVSDRRGPDLRAAGDRPQLLCGPGRMPDLGSAVPSWGGASSEGLNAWLQDAAITPDPWGNCYVATAEWVISAGANGLLDTPPASLVPQGDDVGMRVR